MKFSINKPALSAFALAASIALLSACGSAGSPTPAATPEPTPEPTPSVAIGDNMYWGDETKLDLTGLSVDVQEVRGALSAFLKLESVAINDCSWPNSDKLALVEAYPEIDFAWPVELGGTAVSSDSDSLSFAGNAPDCNELIVCAPLLKNVQSIDLSGAMLAPADLIALRSAYPDAEIISGVSAFGIELSTADTVIDLTECTVDDLSRIEELIAALPSAEKIILPAETPFTNDEIDTLNKAYDDVQIVWTVYFGYGRWGVRTDITVFSTLQPWPVGYRYTNSDLENLFKYCHDIVALDLGHNDITDMQPFTNFKKLKVLIIGENPNLVDISPLGEITTLEYLEIFSADNIRDFSAISNLTNMVDLDISYCIGLDHVDFLENMPNLKMGWFCGNHIDSSLWAEAEAAHPDTTFLFYWPGIPDATSGGWRKTDRNIAIRQAFMNWRYVESFVSWDDVTYQEGAEIIRAIPLDH